VTLRQRQPPLRDPGYLAWLRKQRCACCKQAPPCDAAHLRATSFVYGKAGGIGMKPDDRWALPLKHNHHMAQHAHGNELEWWAAQGVENPFDLCVTYYKRYLLTKGID
jgi:surface antigen